MDEHQRFARSWIDAWNQRDLDLILDHYSPDAEVRSPRAAGAVPGSRGVVRGHAALRGYWGRAIASAPDLRFDLEVVFTTVDGVSLLYRNHRGELVVETLLLGPGGLVTEAIVAYSPPPAASNRAAADPGSRR